MSYTSNDRNYIFVPDNTASPTSINYARVFPTDPGLLDVQVNKKLPKLNLTAKIGASNALNNKVLQVYGGPYVGRMIYFSISNLKASSILGK